jgi:hypothetical protein
MTNYFGMVAHGTTGSPVPDTVTQGGITLNKDAKNATGDVKTDVKTQAPRLTGLRGSMKPIDVWLAHDVDLTSSSSTAYTTVFAVNANNCPEFTSYATLYDEMKHVEAKLVFKFCISGTITDVGQQNVIAFDPMTTTALGSTQEGCQHAQHILWGSNFSTSTAVALPSLVTKHGMMTLKMKPPNRKKNNDELGIDANGAVQQWSGWNRVTASMQAAMGYVKPYLEGVGSGGVTNIRGIMYIRVMFRSRG